MLFGDQIILYNLDLGHFVLHKSEKDQLKTNLRKSKALITFGNKKFDNRLQKSRHIISKI